MPLSPQKLMKVYAELPLFERELLELISVFYMPVRISTLGEVLWNMGKRDAAGKRIQTDLITQALNSLSRKKLVVKSGNACVCERSIVERVTRNMVLEGNFDAAEPLVRNAIRYTERWAGSIEFDSEDRVIANVRLPIYAHDFTRLYRVIDDIGRASHVPLLEENPITSIIKNSFDPIWLDSFPAAQVGYWMGIVIQDCLHLGEAVGAYVDFVCARMERFDENHQATQRFALAEVAFYQGRFDEMFAWARDVGVFGELLIARHTLVAGTAEEAVARYDACFAEIRRATGKRKPKFGTIDWAYYILALLKSGEVNWSRALEFATWGASDKAYNYTDLCRELAGLIRRESGTKDVAQSTLFRARYEDWRLQADVTAQHLSLLVAIWMEWEPVKHNGGCIEALCSRLASHGYYWLEQELASILAFGEHKGGGYGKRAGSLRKSLGVTPLLDIVRPLESWERTLKALLHVATPDLASEVRSNPTRLAWFLSEFRGEWRAEPKEQKCSAKGTWSKGRNVSLMRLRNEGDSWDFLLPQDHAARKSIRVETDGYWGRGGVYYEMSEEVMTSLAGHPHVFMLDTGAQVEVVVHEPELQVTSSKRGFQIRLVPEKPASGLIRVERQGDTRVIVYAYNAKTSLLADILGKELSVPARAREDVLEAVRNVSSLVTVHSDIGIGDESIPVVAADATPVVQLLPSGDGLLVHLRVRPLPDGGPVFAPAAGGEMVIAEVNGVRIQAARDFKQENAAAALLTAACPTLTGEMSGGFEWRIETPEEALEFLMEMEACSPPPRIEWPKGQKYAIQGKAGLGQFRARITGGHNWFDVSGELVVDKELVLDMQRLLELTAGSNSRFIELREGQFVALTQAFRNKLDELRGLAEEQDGALRMHALAAPMVDDLVEEVASLKSNKKWKEQLERLRNARELTPEVPPTLRAELRPYQRDGYQWLVRLSAWGVGACLADDMGLGKTVQLLALMLRRAEDGPQLVVAPTSVCANWEDEAARFAPTLNVHRFGTGNREETLASLGNYDLLIVSYGLLQTQYALFKSVTWQTIVLDEAQAIKNMATKRSKAAMALDGEFKVVATGTPIENHLGEIWNLFRFINPGFLGTLDRFNTRFAVPIEKHQERNAARLLKQAIQPFILRRRKSEVLSDLPARTDIVLHVELGDKERAFYEALRLRALKQLSDVKQAPGKNHVRILAEIMRLRRACCNAQLVDQNSTLPSAKLEVLEALLDELMENRHQALVFSQFVDHLTILRSLLDRKGITYQYLDGSTPPAARKKAVDSFQSGQGDVFLISLKAGGLGLNLTAADYVIHMDPWWNPAVEDQASDRAHRIGQQRPVTVYRLVVRNTIEDQITELHHRKRDLANNLLEGTDIAGKISAEELLALLRDG